MLQNTSIIAEIMTEVRYIYDSGHPSKSALAIILATNSTCLTGTKIKLADKLIFIIIQWHDS